MYVIIMYYFYEHVCLYHFLNTMLGAERVNIVAMNVQSDSNAEETPVRKGKKF